MLQPSARRKLVLTFILGIISCIVFSLIVPQKEYRVILQQHFREQEPIAEIDAWLAEVLQAEYEKLTSNPKLFRFVE